MGSNFAFPDGPPVTCVFTFPVNETGPSGNTGGTGPVGPAGPPGQGVAAGGSAGHVLLKQSATNYHALWTNPVPTGATASRYLADQLLDDVTVKDWGAVGDGIVSDYAAFVAMLAAKGYAQLAPGVYVISTAFALAAGQRLRGLSGLARLVGTNTLGNGLGIVRALAVTDVLIDGLDLELPVAVNQLRGVLVDGDSHDITIRNFRANVLGTGAYPVAVLNGNHDRFTFINFDSRQEGKCLWKPNVNAPTVPTFVGRDALIGAGRFRGQGAVGGKSGWPMDGGYQNAVIFGVQATDMVDTVGIEGFGFGIANDTGLAEQGRGYLLMGAGVRNIHREGFHSEDEQLGTQVIGFQVLDAGRGADILSQVQGRTRFANFIGIFTDGTANDGWRMADAGGGGHSNVNIIGGLFHDWGNAVDSYGLRAGGVSSTDLNFLANHFGGSGSGGALYCDGIKSRIAYNHVESASTYGISLVTPDSSTLIESNNVLSGATLGPIDLTLVNIDGAEGDQEVQFQFQIDGTTTSQVVHYFRRAAVITRLESVYVQANTTVTTARRVNFGLAGAAVDSVIQAAMGIGDAQYSVRNHQFFTSSQAGRKIPAGSVLMAAGNGTGDGSYLVRFRINFFYYD